MATTQAQLEEIATLLQSPNKSNLIQLNELRREISNSYLSTCFCSSNERQSFYLDCQIWYNQLLEAASQTPTETNE